MDVHSGNIFRALNKDGGLAGRVRNKGGSYTDGNLSPQAICDIVNEHATAAALAPKGGADLGQIQRRLGHASITTTEKYLEPMRSPEVTAGDYIQIELALAEE